MSEYGPTFWDVIETTECGSCCEKDQNDAVTRQYVFLALLIFISLRYRIQRDHGEEVYASMPALGGRSHSEAGKP